MHTLEVSTPSARYPVCVGPGLLRDLGASLLPSYARKGVAVLTTPPVWELWGEAFLQSFAPSGAPRAILSLPPGEAAKRLSEVERLAEEMAAAGADRAWTLVAFGGGIVGDVGGFLAAMYMRGIPYVQVPTTLLAQVDSSVGGKTGANLRVGKNLVGAFHHPAAVFADVSLLRTLPPRELRAGLVEVVKAAVIRDRELFALLEARMDELLQPGCDPELLSEVVARSVAIKAAVVGADERESGLRMILNLGHTVGHAIEAASGYTALLHGEAVAWGMLPALRIAQDRGLLRPEEAGRVRSLLGRLGPLPGFAADADTLMEAAGRDKKNFAGTRRFVLPQGIGDAVVVEDVADGELQAAVEAMLEEVPHA